MVRGARRKEYRFTETFHYLVMVVSFHHKYGPQVEYCNPPLPNNPLGTSSSSNPPTGEAIPLPDEWSYLGFICLPDGAHAAEEEYIYFHLPPVKGWNADPSYQQTLFGLACFRQIDSKVRALNRSTLRLCGHSSVCTQQLWKSLPLTHSLQLLL